MASAFPWVHLKLTQHLRYFCEGSWIGFLKLGYLLLGYFGNLKYIHDPTIEILRMISILRGY